MVNDDNNSNLDNYYGGSGLKMMPMMLVRAVSMISNIDEHRDWDHAYYYHDNGGLDSVYNAQRKIVKTIM